MPITLTDSPYLIPIPDVDPVHFLNITTSSYATAAAMINANPTVLDFLFAEGDYRSWGTFELLNKAGGTAMRPRTIRYAGTNATLHPARRVEQARIETLKVSAAGSYYWIIQGLQIKNPTDNNSIDQGCIGITLDKMLIEECLVYSLRFRQCTSCGVQRSVIRNANNGNGIPATGVGDSTGVQIAPPSAPGLGYYILDNEIYDCGDCVQWTDGTNLYGSTVEVRMDGNDLYHTADWYIGSTNETWLENAADIKAGSTPANPSYITNNRMWGMRHNGTPTSQGEALVIQKYARNITVSGNIIADCPRGMKDESWPTTATTYTANASTDVLTATGHHRYLGEPCIITNTGGTVPGGLATSTRYYVTNTTTNTMQLATSLANALAGTPVVDITSAGTGTQKIKTDPAAPRDIAVTGNQFLDIRDYATSDTGAAWKPVLNIAYTNNVIARATYLCDISPSAYYSPTFTGNVLREVDNIQRPEDQTPPLLAPTGPYDPAQNSTAAAPESPVEYDTYERKRWTGVELATAGTVVTVVIPHPRVRTVANLTVTPSPRRQANRYGAQRRSVRR